MSGIIDATLTVAMSTDTPSLHSSSSSSSMSAAPSLATSIPSNTTTTTPILTQPLLMQTPSLASLQAAPSVITPTSSSAAAASATSASVAPILPLAIQQQAAMTAYAYMHSDMYKSQPGSYQPPVRAAVPKKQAGRKKRKMPTDDDADDNDAMIEGDANGDGTAASAKTKPASDDAQQVVWPQGTGSRFVASLGLLTKKFIDLMKESAEGIVDLNLAEVKLGVKKRRIYDITNVLEGVGLVHKKSKNTVQWRGSGLVQSVVDTRHELNTLKTELDALTAEESMLDSYIKLMKESIQHTQELESNAAHCYMTYDDICALPNFHDRIVVAVRAPTGTNMDVPSPSDHEPNAYRAILKSSGGPISVDLVNDGGGRGVNGAPDNPDYAQQGGFAFSTPSAHNSLLLPLSPVVTASTSTSAGGMSSVPNSPFRLNGHSPYAIHNLASPAFNRDSHTSFHPRDREHSGGVIHGATHHLAPPSPADPSSALSRHAHLASPGNNARFYVSPYVGGVSGSPYRNHNGNAPVHSSPYNLSGSTIHNLMAQSPGGSTSANVGSTSATSVNAAINAAAPPSTNSVVKLMDSSNDPDYFMNLDSNEGLTDLYRRDEAKDANGSNGGTNSSSRWADDSDNIFNSNFGSPSPGK